MLPLALALILVNGDVVTMSTERPRARVVAISGERITYVGDSLPEARKASPAAEVIDVGGRVVMPGFNDAHVHFGLSLTLGGDHGVDLPELSKRRFIDAVKQASLARPDHGWLFVKIRRLPDGIVRSRDLDFIDRPLFVVTARGGLLNRRGIVVGGFSEEEAPVGFVRGRELAAALDRLVKQLPRRFLERGARAFLSRLAELGITSVQLIDELPELFESLRKDGALTARVRMVPLGYRLGTHMYEPEQTSPAPQWVRVDGVKYFHDDGARMTRFELEELFDRTVAANRRVVIHVLSRRALDSLLDSVEATARSRKRPDGPSLYRVDHADEVTSEQAERLARLGIVVCSNPSMLPEWHAKRAFPMRTLGQAGVRTCIGTDWVGSHLPARPLEPMAGIALAVGRGGLGPEERIEPIAALEAYTVGSAAAEGLANDKGSLTPGKLADLVVLAADPTRIPLVELPGIETLLTVVGGRIVHRTGPFHISTPSKPPPSTIGPAIRQPPTIGPKPSTPLNK